MDPEAGRLFSVHTQPKVNPHEEIDEKKGECDVYTDPFQQTLALCGLSLSSLETFYESDMPVATPALQNVAS